MVKSRARSSMLTCSILATFWESWKNALSRGEKAIGKIKIPYRLPQSCLKRDFGLARESWQVPCQQAGAAVRMESSAITIKLTLSVAIVSGTSSPRTSFKKILLKDRSIMRESSIALATNCPMTRKICVLFLHKPTLDTRFPKNSVESRTVRHHWWYLLGLLALGRGH